MLTGHRSAYRQAFMYAFGRIEQEPVRPAVAFQPDEVAAADVIPAEVALTIHCLRK